MTDAVADTSNPDDDSRIQDEEAIRMIVELDAECGDYCSRDDALSTWNIMDAGQYDELVERLEQIELQLAVIVGMIADNHRAAIEKMEEISGQTPYYGSYS